MLNVFVFSSNLRGRPCKGSAVTAYQSWGAQHGVAEGRTGQAYAIPCRNEKNQLLPLQSIGEAIGRFLEYARDHSYIHFNVTPIGCGLFIGYRSREIAPFFRDAPPNCTLPPQLVPPPVLSQEPFHAPAHPGNPDPH